MKPLVLVGMLAGLFAGFMVMDYQDKGRIRIDWGFWAGIGLHVFLLVVLAIGIWHARKQGKFMTSDGVGVVIAIVLSYLTFVIGTICYW